MGRGFEAHDNANLQENAETSHKKAEQENLKRAVPSSSCPRTFQTTVYPARCTSTTWMLAPAPVLQQEGVRYFLYYGLIQQKRRNLKASVAASKRAEVAILCQML